jgi:hypothetical protein
MEDREVDALASARKKEIALIQAVASLLSASIQ